MALIPKDKYPAQINAVDPAYPYGRARNVSTPRDGTGTPWEADLVNDIFGSQQALLKKAGITPSGVPDTADASQYLEAIAWHTKDLNAVYALQFPEIVRGYDVDPHVPFQVTSCLDSDYRPWLVVGHSTGRVKRNLSVYPDDAIGGAQPSGAYVEITSISGAQDNFLLAVESSTGIVYASTDAGNTWPDNAALPSTGGWSALNYSTELSKWIVVGTNKGAHSPPASGLAWTAATGTGTLGTPRRVAVPRAGETGHGAFVVPELAGMATHYTLDGAAFVSTAWGGPINDGCWSEYHQRWFAIMAGGQLYQAPALNGIWTLAATLWQAGFSIYRRMYPFGRYLIFLGDVVSGPSNRTVGSVCVTDLTSYGAFTIDGGEHYDIFEHDGRLVLMRGASGPQVDLALGMRAPSLL